MTALKKSEEHILDTGGRKKFHNMHVPARRM